MTTTVFSTKGEDFVELASTNKGKLFKKAILRVGESFVHPANPKMKVNVDDTFADKLIENFNAGYCDTVQFPMVNEKNQHVEDPARNLGQVVKLTKENGNVVATIDVRKSADDIGTTVLGASAMMNLNYTDTITGEKVGPTLLHVAATNRPYLTKLAPYEAVALSNSDDEVVVLSRVDDAPGSTESSEVDMTDLNQLLDALKEEHGIDVAELQEQVALSNSQADDSDVSELVAALSNVLQAADPNLVALSNADEDDVSVDDVAMGVVELSRNYASLSDRLSSLETERASAEVDALVKAGKILPHQREAMLELRLSNEEMFESLVPDHSIVALSETGFTSHEQPGGVSYADEVERLISGINKSSGPANA